MRTKITSNTMLTQPAMTAGLKATPLDFRSAARSHNVLSQSTFGASRLSPASRIAARQR